MASTIFGSLFRRASPAPANPIHFRYTAETNPFRAKRHWPPDFSKLSQKHQFRLERRFRRRTKLKWARPTWMKVTKLTQWGSILFVCVYGTLFLDMGEGETAFDGVRRWYAEQLGSIQASREFEGGSRSGGGAGAMEKKQET
ncbi:hypothetical protein B0A50_01006 [Salinomyces thailandicus]|uniref:Uncharacterized protein n=1 Tax=Salinomyces thailandicus TaxID=706561 RepID=A0A4U0UBF2_9PEZI|nr:hypothetical protein B0A50_01006 [Salinomyces thailandica]